ncbi:MAG: carboxymuconolactone decarboxylase family protein [Myxococcales bacterium]|nr:carboxymuconolactone decarboxylase family protein [Myxococcales bacterium]
MGARFALARQQGLTEEMIAELPRYRESDAFNDAEKAAIRLADILSGDHKAASDELFDELRKHYTEPEILDLCFRITSFVGYGRMIRVLDLEIGETCPIGHKR